MSDLNELEQRVAELERRVGLESGLRASGDRDLADMAQTLRAQQHTIQALAITQSQHNEKLDRLTEMQVTVLAKVNEIVELLERGA